ncbi:hypothetical protein [Halogranum rubrum]|uniref:Uncharacterized protein n=1 Tax=Halogranum salarium B-1 TaxID=1210908 RepID=J3ESW8_9EURY|nr:hypothetical protein [Halogranum salarium]EJN57102.1 hypothetical protein HSB1_44880 [Halogranum salarium B-1]
MVLSNVESGMSETTRSMDSPQTSHTSQISQTSQTSQTFQTSQTPPENKIAKAVDALRLVTWSLFTLFVAALVVVPVVGPYVLGNPVLAGEMPVLFGILLGGLFVGTLVAVVLEVFLY